MRFCVLGPLEAYEDGRPVKIGGGRQRGLLALLLVYAGEIVSRDRLIDELWSGSPPEAASQSLDAYVSRLRRALREAGADGLLATRAPGYVLRAEDTDAAQFETTVRAGRQALATGDCTRAAALLREALALWRGAAYVELADEMWARPEAERLEELRLAAIEDRIEAELALGGHAALVPELELLAARHPTRERLVGQLIVALYRNGRQADALAAYSTARNSLVEQLGLEPGPELRRLEAAVLAQDTALDLVPTERSQPAPVQSPPAAVVALEGERKQVTVLFADVMGSMELAEQLDLEEWRRIMQRFFSILGEGVHRLGGTVDKFTGDGIMALFGAPIAHEDHARRACYAALHLQRELAGFAGELRRRPGLSFAARIGLNSGEVVVGAVGEDLGMSYTAVGHTVGLAQRMEQLAEPGRVYLSEYTASLVEGYLELADLGEFDIKGVSRRLCVHELIGVGMARGALDVARVRGLSRFVGRAEELRGLQDALEQASAGNGRVIGVVGEAGVGKSRLCHEFAERQRAEGVLVYRVAGQAHAKSVPLLPVLEYLRAYFEISERDSDRAARERINARLLSLDDRLGDELPLLFDFLGVADTDRPVERMDPEARQRRLLAFMKRLTRAQSAQEPIVTVVEDLHWLDAASEVFLANHVDAIRGTRALTVVNFRPEYRAEWMSRSYYDQIALDALGPEPVHELLAELLGTDPSLVELAGLIGERTQGNPFFIEELVRSLAEGGSLEGERGDYRLVRPPDQTALPATVQVVLAARIDRLSPRDKAVLQAAAVIGREFPQPVLERLVNLEPTELGDALRTLAAGEFVHEQERDPEPLYAFGHPLTREVVYGSQLAERRATVHAAIARTIEALYPERLDERAALLAGHWEAAGEPLEAAGWHARASDWVGIGDPRQSLAHDRRVRELADAVAGSAEAGWLGLRARIALLAYGWRLGISRDEAATLFREAESMAAREGDLRVRALLLCIYAAVKGLSEGDMREYARLAREAVALAEETGDHMLYVVVASCSYAFFCVGEYQDTVAVCDRAIELADGDPTVGIDIGKRCHYAHCHELKGLSLAALGELEEARALMERGRELARDQGDIEVVGISYQWSSALAHLQGRPAVALAHARHGLESAETRRDPVRAPRARGDGVLPRSPAAEAAGPAMREATTRGVRRSPSAPERAGTG